MLITDHTCAAPEVGARPCEQPGKRPNRSPTKAESERLEWDKEEETDGEEKGREKGGRSSSGSRSSSTESQSRSCHTMIGAALHNEHAVAVREEPILNLDFRQRGVSGGMQ